MSPGPARPPTATGYRFAWEPKPKPEPKRHQLGWQRTAPALPASPPPLESLLQSGHLLLNGITLLKRILAEVLGQEFEWYPSNPSKVGLSLEAFKDRLGDASNSWRKH
eukprot:scaffold39556_cov73-Phaeocystis_antarctica.AAC.1